MTGGVSSYEEDGQAEDGRELEAERLEAVVPEPGHATDRAARAAAGPGSHRDLQEALALAVLDKPDLAVDEARNLVGAVGKCATQHECLNG